MAAEMIKTILKRGALTLSCQAGRKLVALTSALTLAAAPAAQAAPAGWAHQAAGFQSNGAVTVKSLSGGSYSGTQNPTGAVAKANQNAATQAPTVIIQATSSMPFSYLTDCYIMTINSALVIGAGKLDASNRFTGMIAGTNANGAGASVVLAALTGAQTTSSGTANQYTLTYWCGSDVSCLTQISSGPAPSYVYLVAGMPTTARQKCYP